VSDLRPRSCLAIALVFAAAGCSDSEDPTPAGNGGGNNAGAAGAGAAAAGVSGAAGSDAGGESGAAGAGAGTAGASGAAGSGGAEYPTPDKLIALTFDDGPNVALTGAVLDKLEAHDVPASFFLIGQNINAGTQPVLQRAASLGCEFENHSFGFNSLTGLTREAIEMSVGNTTAAIEQFTDDSPVFFRPPNLAVDALMYEVIDYPFAGGILGRDYPAEFGGDPTIQAVSDTVLNGAQDGSIILLHDVQPALNPQPTPDALDIIIPALKAQGFEFVTLRQLFTRRGVDPNSQQDTIWQSVPPAP
jgi:peptidoglycan/xylan/chitin deacetylase (PgdA/CDA1 family)